MYHDKPYWQLTAAKKASEKNLMEKKMVQKLVVKLCSEDPDHKRGLKMTFEMPTGFDEAFAAKASHRFELTRENEAFSSAVVLHQLCSCRVPKTTAAPSADYDRSGQNLLQASATTNQ